jgi:hypothetical protein
MKAQDFEALLLEAMQNADKAPANVKAVMDEIKVQLTTLETQGTKIAEQEKRIRDLQDTNMKLFLGQTMQVKDTEPEEPENPVAIFLRNN